MPGILTALKNIFTKGSKASKVNKAKGYPFEGSLDANFQDFAKKHLLNQKGFFGPGGYRGKFQQNIDKFKVNKSEFQKNIDKTKITENKQLKLDLKRGGAIGPNGVL